MTERSCGERAVSTINNFGSTHGDERATILNETTLRGNREAFMRQGRLQMTLLAAFVLLAPMKQDAPATASTPATPGKPVALIPFELYHNRVYLPVRVNGSRPYTMTLDTGAAETFVSEKVADELKLPRKGRAQVHGNGEVVEQFPLAKNVSFKVGDATCWRRPSSFTTMMILRNTKAAR